MGSETDAISEQTSSKATVALSSENCDRVITRIAERRGRSRVQDCSNLRRRVATAHDIVKDGIEPLLENVNLDRLTRRDLREYVAASKVAQYHGWQDDLNIVFERWIDRRFKLACKDSSVYNPRTTLSIARNWEKAFGLELKQEWILMLSLIGTHYSTSGNRICIYPSGHMGWLKVNIYGLDEEPHFAWDYKMYVKSAENGLVELHNCHSEITISITNKSLKLNDTTHRSVPNCTLFFQGAIA